jgi:hypothetical protein
MEKKMEHIATIDAEQLSDSSKNIVELDFNPSGDACVEAIKLLAAALITVCETIRYGGGSVREADVAIALAQGASMWAVHAQTAHLDRVSAR